MAGELAIDLQNVRKLYRAGFRRKVEALRGVAMRVGRGEIYGLLGPNGAGKSTLVKCMMTVVRPTAAQGNVLGAPLGDKATLQRVGYLPEAHRFPGYLTGRGLVEFFGGLQGMPRRARRKRAGELLDLVGMSDWGDTRITKYSKGMLQRVGLAQAMVADPDLVVLDEPTDGVDPVARRQIRDALLAIRDAGKTVFLNSHLLGELEELCDRVGIMVGGVIHSEGTPDELALGKVWYEIDVDEPTHLDMPGLSWTDRTLRVEVTDPAGVQPVIDALRGAGRTIVRVQQRRPSLEDLFMEAVGEGPGAMQAGRRSETAPPPPIPNVAPAEVQP
ncbi:MAG: ABC transporter ATP-binding protein [Planctomycetota bacterium]